MTSTAPIAIVLVIAFLLGLKFAIDLAKHRRRKVKLGLCDIRPRGTTKERKAGSKSVLR